MRRLLPLLPLLVVTACSDTDRPTPKPKTDTPPPPAVRITQFYGSPEQVPRGEKAKLCYGVEGAKTLKLDPPVERVWPAYTRCFDVDPEKNRVFTLTAMDDQGHSAQQTVHLAVGPPRATILEVSVNQLEVKAGEVVTLCYKAKNAVAVDVEPGKLMTHDSNKGCVSDQPKATTTYRVKVTGGDGGTDSEQVTVRVR